MSFELINDCVLIPTPADWRAGTRDTRRWSTEIASGVTSAEDRASGLVTPHRGMECTLTALDVQERAKLAALLAEALKYGRAAVPHHGRAARILSAATPYGVTHASLWPYRPGDRVMISRRGICEHREIRVNAGGSATGSFLADVWATGGSAATTATAVDCRNLAEGASANLRTALQSLRGTTAASIAGATISYAIPGFVPGVPVRLRLYFAEIQAGYDRSSEQRIFSIAASGADTTLDFEPYVAAGNRLNRAVLVEKQAWPEADGTLRITLTPRPQSVAGSGYHAGINAIEAYQVTRETRQLTSAMDRTTCAWDTPVRGYYDGGLVMPILFGTPSLSDTDHITDAIQTFRLRVEEPIALGSLATSGSCPAEICLTALPRYYPDGNITWPKIPGCPDTQYKESDYVWGLVYGQDPSAILSRGQVNCHLGLHEIEFNQAYPLAQKGDVFWAFVPGNDIMKKSMSAKHATPGGNCDPNTATGDVVGSFDGYATLVTAYCP